MREGQSPFAYSMSPISKMDSSDSLMNAYAANGSVYSWGGGGEGQLGHGEDVLYLSQPKVLGKDVLPRQVSQVACGDSYSAAVLGN